jgi:co-chaperonin GroES (HSP10)
MEEEKIEYLTPDDLKVRPVERMLFIELDPKHERAGTLWLAKKNRQITRVGTVKAVGPKVTLFEVGDKVLMDHWAGHNLNLPKYHIFEGEEGGAWLKMVPENEIWSFIDE